MKRLGRLGLALCCGWLVAASGAGRTAPPDDPQHGEIGGEPGGQYPHMSATPCVNGVAGQYSCANVDVLTFLPLDHIGGAAGDQGNDVWGWTDPQTGGEYALMGLSNGTSFVDIADPQNPVYLGILPTHTVNSSWRDIKVYADHAFIVSEAAGHGMQVFDLTQLRNVMAPPVTFSATAHYSGFSRAHNIVINEQTGFAYAVGTNTCSGGLHMIDIQDPVNPVNAGCFSADGYTHDAQCVVYAGPDASFQGREICFNSNEDTLTIVDVTDKAAPAMLSRATYSGSSYTHQGWLTEDHRFFLLDDEGDERTLTTKTRTHIWDVSSLQAPRRIGVYESALGSIDHNLYIRGNLAYETNYRSGLRILDLSDMASGVLREVAYFDVFPADDAVGFNGAWSNYPFFASGTVLVSGIEQGLFLLKHDTGGNGQGLTNFQVAASPQTAPVSAGQSAAYNLAVVPQNGFNGAVSLGCTGLPAGASCSFSTNPVSASAAPVNVTLTIRTTAASAQLAPHLAPWVYATLFFGFLGLLGGGHARGTKTSGFFLIAGLALFLAAVAACGGGDRTSAPPAPPPAPTGPSTPAGNYSVIVNSSAGSLQHATPLALAVQ